MFLFRDRSLNLEEKNAWIMGILNVTPDSFSDGDVSLEQKMEHLLSQSPDMIDIGGESTRPGADFISAEEEWLRISPVLSRIKEWDPAMIVSVDTRKSRVARLALEAGADIINDVSCLRYDPEMANVVAEYSAGLILNHSRGTPETMGNHEYLQYPDGVVRMVAGELQVAVDKAIACGVRRESIILDPGLGFAKNTEQNLALLGDIPELLSMGYPLLSGPSRKRFIGDVTGEKSALERDFGTCGAVAASYFSGYSIFRVHNVKAAKDCLSVLSCVRKNPKKAENT